MFSLSFNVTNASPTSVSCSVNDNHFNVSENDIIRTIESSEDPISVQVSVLIRMRVPGVYQCTVIADRVTQDDLVSDAVMSGNITGETGLVFDFLLFFVVAPAPSSLTYTRHGLNLIELNWMGTAGQDYELFISRDDDVIDSYSTNDSNLYYEASPNVEYSASVVAVGEYLPSEVLNITITPGMVVNFIRFYYIIIIFYYYYSCSPEDNKYYC